MNQRVMLEQRQRLHFYPTDKERGRRMNGLRARLVSLRGRCNL